MESKLWGLGDTLSHPDLEEEDEGGEDFSHMSWASPESVRFQDSKLNAYNPDQVKKVA